MCELVFSMMSNEVFRYLDLDAARMSGFFSFSRFMLLLGHGME